MTWDSLRISGIPRKAVGRSGSLLNDTYCVCSADQHDPELGGHAMGSTLGARPNLLGNPIQVQETPFQQLQQQLAGLGLSPTTLAAQLATPSKFPSTMTHSQART